MSDEDKAELGGPGSGTMEFSGLTMQKMDEINKINAVIIPLSNNKPAYNLTALKIG